jgi:chromosome partitioning protein
LKTIVCAIEKGGQGKSTLASHLAWLCAALGKRVIAIDLDGQGDLTKFLLGTCDKDAAPSFALFEGKVTKPLAVPLPDYAGSLHLYTGDRPRLRQVDESIAIRIEALGACLKKLTPHYDVCVIDAPPGSAKRMEAALIAATHVVMPFEAKFASVGGLKGLLETLEFIKGKYNRNLNIIGFLPNRINSRSKSEKTNLAALQKAAPGKVLPFKLHERTSFADAVENQTPVWEKINGASHRKAADEMMAACTHIVKTIFAK